ncbi:hypothetical protein Tco_0196554, partial [Tanacetum coccineum]
AALLLFVCLLCLFAEEKLSSILAFYFALVLVRIIKTVELSLGELWDCQLGNLTAGKGSGGGGRGLSMGELGLQDKTEKVNP